MALWVGRQVGPYFGTGLQPISTMLEGENRMKYAPGAFPFSFGLGGRSCSNFRASTLRSSSRARSRGSAFVMSLMRGAKKS